MSEIFYDLEVGWNIRPHALAWIDGDSAKDGSGLGLNREYVDLRGATWAEVERVLELERRLIAAKTASDGPGVSNVITEDAAQFSCVGLDLGVAAATLGLAVAGCVPFTSCNGGAFGDTHADEYPLVAFFMAQSAVAPVVEAAKVAGVGLHHDQHGLVHVYARFIKDMVVFAAALSERTRPGESAALAKRRDR